MKNLLVTFSGGRTSAFMAKVIKENLKYADYNKLFVFANTGKERAETLEFVNRCDVEFNLNLTWLEADVNQEKGFGTNYKKVCFQTASRNGEPFENVLKKYGLPSKLYRHCTRELKEVPIHKYAKDYFNSLYFTALGIRADEPHRISTKNNYIYPLVELRITEKVVRSWWKLQTFDLQLKDYEGNCDLCFLKSKRKKMTILSEYPDIADWWCKMEEKYNTEHQEKFDVINNTSIQEYLQMSKTQFNKAQDKEELREKQGDLFDFEMDIEHNCFCKNN